MRIIVANAAHLQMQEEWGHELAAETLPAEEGVAMAVVLGVEDGGYMEAPGTIVGEIVDERPTQDLPPGLSPLGYIVNRWKTHDGEHRAGRMLGFQGRNACLEATWGPGGNKPGEVPWELFPADEWNPNTGQRVARGTWNPLCGNHGSPGAFSHQGGGRLYYIVNRWKTHDGESRAGLMLGFNGHNAILEGRWGEPGGRDKVVWELFPADEWDPHTGKRVARGSWNPLRGNHGTSGTFAHQGGGKLYYIVNRWKAHNGEHRAGRMLGFTGENAVLEGTWGRPGGRDKVPWELFPADEWTPMGNRVERGSFNPLRGGHGTSCSPGTFSHRLGDLPVVIPPATECCTLM